MIANTHRMVGEFLYQQLSPSNQAFIHKRRFVYGNIKPDIHQKYLRMSHYHRDNEEIIFDMLHRLLNSKASIPEFSENLGILIHFFCDYTCIIMRMIICTHHIQLDSIFNMKESYICMHHAS